MNLTLSPEQALLRDTFADFFVRRCSIEALRKAEDGGGHDPGLWAEFAELGGHLVAVPGDDPALTGQLVEAALVALEAGRRLAPIPATESAVGHRIVTLADPATAESIAPTASMTLGLARPGSLSANGESRLNGEIFPTRSGAVADHALIASGGDLCLLDLNTAGVTCHSVDNLGRFPMAVLECQDVPVRRLAEENPNLARRLRTEARVLHAAELVGAGRQSLALAVDYVKERRQFDRPIGSFGAVQHRLADRMTALDAAELLVLRAGCAVGDLDALRYYSAVALLRAREAADLAAKESLQFHGGYGFVTEYDVHRYVRFTKALGILAADRDVPRDALPRSARPTMPRAGE